MPAARASLSVSPAAASAACTLSLHDALPIWITLRLIPRPPARATLLALFADIRGAVEGRSEEHTSELQSQSNLVCRLLLEKKMRVSSNSTTTYRLPRLTAGKPRVKVAYS